MNKEKVPRDIEVLVIISSTLGTIYILLGLCSTVAKALGTCKTVVTPGDVGLIVILVSIGAVMLSSIIFLNRKDLVLSVASSLVGISLAVGAMAIQLLCVGASWLDGLITGSPLSRNDIIQGVLRGDALLGYVTLPLLPFAIKIAKEKVIK